ATTLSEGLRAALDDARAFGAMKAAASPPFVQNLRRDGLEALGRLGLPRSSDEEWRFSSVATVARRLPDFVSAAAAPDVGPPTSPAARAVLATFGPLCGPGWRHHQLVFVNGRLDPELSRFEGLPPGVRFEALSRLFAVPPDLLEKRLGLLGGHRVQPFVAMNAAFLLDGVFLHVPDGVVLPEPLLVVHVADGSAGPVASHPRVVVSLGENAQATVVEAYCGGGAAFVNPVTEILLSAHAHLDHTTLQEESLEALHVGTAEAHLGPGAQLFSHVLSVGGGIVRNELTVRLHGDGAGATLDGLFLARGGQQVDNHTLIDHSRPHCGSQQYYKGVLDGSARGVFDGKVIVRPAAAFTDAHQKNRNLLLSDTSRVDAKPQLEIYNNDVKCTHGSATGRLDADALFYLRSRALSEEQARSVLTLAFASEIVDRIPLEPLKAHLTGRVLGWLNGSPVEPR
ncbi:MAG: Fe-S cluster assembly protein SufD, partial [Deltaproteobacteria bacterium]|nr:Fe-S cluster assembly protein SufD [Deltaproteobacteria bacterium]